MVRLRTVVILVSALIVGILAYLCFSPTEEKRVRKQFDLLSQYVEKAPGEDPFSMANRIQNLSRLFAENCEFKIEGDPLYSLSGRYSRQEVAGYALRGRSFFSEMTLKFYDLKVQFPERGLSQVRLTARLTGRSNTGERAEEIRELLCLLTQIEKKWLFSQFEVVEVLKR